MHGLPPYLLILIYAALLLAPLVLAAAAGAFEGGAWRVAALVTGLVALAMLLLQFISSGRFEALSGRVGIDNTMRFHQLAARALLLLALVHPLLFMVPADGDWSGAGNMAIMLLSAPFLATGLIALLLLVLLVPAGMLRQRLPMRYEYWRAGHLVLALSAAGFSVHHALSVGSAGNSAWMQGFWHAMLALALGTVLVVYLIKPWWLLRNAYRVRENRSAAHGIRELVLEPDRGRSIRFEAGQFAWVLINQPPVPLLDHPFSFSSAPEELPVVRLLIKARGDFTEALAAVASGKRVYLDAPHGNFTLRGRHGDTLLLVAGGIGIAPIMGLLRHLAARRDPRPLGLLIGARNPAQMVHVAEIESLAAILDLRVELFVDEPPEGWRGRRGPLDRAALQRGLRAEPARSLCFICGPTRMMLACEQSLRSLGVPAAQIVYERFDYD